MCVQEDLVISTNYINFHFKCFQQRLTSNHSFLDTVYKISSSSVEPPNTASRDTSNIHSYEVQYYSQLSVHCTSIGLVAVYYSQLSGHCL